MTEKMMQPNIEQAEESALIMACLAFNYGMKVTSESTYTPIDHNLVKKVTVSIDEMQLPVILGSYFIKAFEGLGVVKQGQSLSEVI
tara:strand:+ start:23 stop:280 length:258 start_codon:yes stop_codon:yes gene_type:complete